ncbi:cytochrome P450 monooxygenase PC-foxy1 [Roridomyces roridus]|uniref:Cytochrome P450 monooxygenase PC-foxy1 n=1 Tax=Roridomyces roridus TaxID=1738132 RepID=A0AAD7BPC2_9AGAR|nr:cytochrome P450 monooxygenase PC-foxy1 [Roridomyces roridus]
MRVRQYSISSSPLWNSRHVSLTFSVFERPSLSIYDSPPPLLGVGSNYLANLLPGDRVLMAVRHCKSNPSTYAFRLPEDASTPVVMFCAGSGIAPMRGFIQERAAQRASGCEVGKMILFFGCRAPELDFLYAETDIREWVRLGLLDVRSAFSRKPQESEGCVYVQHRVWHDRADVVAAYKNGASFFTCGSSAVAKGVKATLLEIIKEAENCDDTEAATRLKTIKYATEIFE